MKSWERVDLGHQENIWEQQYGLMLRKKKHICFEGPSGESQKKQHFVFVDLEKV